MSPGGAGQAALIDVAQLQALIDVLAASGFRVAAPTVRDGAIIYDEIRSLDELPRGWTERQEAGHYRLERRTDAALFGYAVGPQSWKRFLHPPRERLWTLRREGAEVSEEAQAGEAPWAFVGVRPCELRALAIQDRVFLQGPYRDAAYQRRRQGVFIVAVNCGEPGGTCFCVSMQSGPRAEQGYDLALTELIGPPQRFLVEAGSERGAAVLAQLGSRPASPEDLEAAAALIAAARTRMGRRLDTEGLQPLLKDNAQHPHWAEVAERCLGCANCTMVCPTCFCTTVEDHTDLAGDRAWRDRRWDSCFTLDFSYLHGGSVRQQTSARYRQWMTHKLSSWIDQFGESGCVGCGRCITWCPVGIDITAEAAALRESAAAAGGGDHGRT